MVALLHPARAYGAVERYVEAIGRALREDDVLVHPGVPQLARLPLRTIELRDPSTARLHRLLRSLRPDVVHVTDVWPRALVAAWLARAPRTLVTHHTPELPRRDNLAGRAWWRAGWWTRPEVVYTSEADRERDGRRPSHVIPLGIDLERFGRPPARPDGDPVIGTVGRLSEQKGHRHLVEAAPAILARHPTARFVIVGDGELRGPLERTARAAGVAERFTFTGARDDVPDLLASFHVFVLPSLFEGLCLAVLEAQAAGVPVVATPVGGVRETVVDGETGAVVPVGDAAALAGAVSRLLDAPARALKLAEEARRRVGERFSEGRMVTETLALYGLAAGRPTERDQVVAEPG
jgi:glycosyltransferase involved in cell wall biosynthesis